MADWRGAARAVGWTVFSASVRVRLGARRHTVRVLEGEEELEFYADVPEAHADELVELLVANRSAGLAYWHVEDGQAWAVSRCPRTATSREMALYLKETAGLADRLELQLSEADRRRAASLDSGGAPWSVRGRRGSCAADVRDGRRHGCVQGWA